MEGYLDEGYLDEGYLDEGYFVALMWDILYICMWPCDLTFALSFILGLREFITV